MAYASFPPPARQTRQAISQHPTLGQDVTLSPTGMASSSSPPLRSLPAGVNHPPARDLHPLGKRRPITSYNNHVITSTDRKTLQG